MVNKNFDLISGELVMYSSTLTEREPLEELCKKYEIPTGWFIKTTPLAALKQALKDTFLAGGNVLIRPAKVGFCVVTENVGDDGNKYISNVRFGFDPNPARNGQVAVLSHDSNHPDIDRFLEPLDRLVEKYQLSVFANRVSGGMSKVLLRKFGATRMRPQGGCFFVPQVWLEDWSDFADDYQAATNNTVHRIQSGCDDNTVLSVMAASMDDLRGRYQEAVAELSDEKKKKAALARLEEIKSRALAIDSSFGKSQTLRDKIAAEIDAEMAIALLG